MLDAISGMDVGAPYAAPSPVRPFLSEVEAAPVPLRIAVSTAPMLARAVHPECVRAVEATVRLLEELGHEVVEAEPAIDGDSFREALIVLIAGSVAADIKEAVALTGATRPRALVESRTWVVRQLGETFTAGDYAEALRTLGVASRAFASFLQPYDAFLSPTLAAPPVAIGALQPSPLEESVGRVVSRIGLSRLALMTGRVGAMAQRMFDFAAYTPFANAGGQPSVSVPLHVSPTGLPIGVLFTGRYGDEATLFRLSAELERARPWSDRRPEVS
jgi:amidase